MRILFGFAKRSRLRFVSHLDLQRFMQMALRRTELPVAYSQGFNPHPQMNFASALAMGWTSDAEILDVKMDRDISEQDAAAQMKQALPPDLPLLQVRKVSDRHPKMMAQLVMADYEICIFGDHASEIAAEIPSFLQETCVMAIRKTKSSEKETDIRPMCISLSAQESENGCLIDARLMLTEKSTLKPDLLIKVLTTRAGAEIPELCHIHRTKLLGLDKCGKPHDLLTL